MCTKDTGKTPFLSGCPSMWPICNTGEKRTYICVCVHIEYIDCIYFLQKQLNCVDPTEHLQVLGQFKADLS